jgi:predicted DNA-binding protein (UPF0251 family)
MVRPRKWRFLSPFIKGHYFKPRGVPHSVLKIADLKGDEVEAMRLCDREECEQEAAGKKMGISRPTVQRLLYSGRKKVVEALVEGKAIQITFPKYVSFRPTPSQGIRYKKARR